MKDDDFKLLGGLLYDRQTFVIVELLSRLKIQIMCLQPQISQPKLGQIGHVGGVLKTSGPADFKSVPGFDN